MKKIDLTLIAYALPKNLFCDAENITTIELPLLPIVPTWFKPMVSLELINLNKVVLKD